MVSASGSADAPGKSASPPITQMLVRFERDANWKRTSVVALTSVLLHAVVLGTCAFVVFKSPQLVEEFFTIVTESDEPAEPIIEQSMMPPDEMNERIQDSMTAPETTSILPFETKASIDLNISDAIPQIETGASQLSGLDDIKVGGETAGRMSSQNKQLMVLKYGGNTASEASVASGMKWLSNHQMPNGNWTFEHSTHPECKGQCSQDGSFTACPTGATGLALLAFLGGGHTHQKGDYQKQVKRAVDYLLKTAEPTPTGLDLRGRVTANEGMYVQGLCTIALSECAAMTGDKRVRRAAEGAIEFIVNAQNPKDGGWRYNPGDAGDTSVVGWEVMALKSAFNAKIKVPGAAFRGAEHFLNLAESDGGSRYKYVPDPAGEGGFPSETMTAVGLLCRMYLGWDNGNEKLAKGVAFLGNVKPQPNNMYFNYYATQVMHHWGGEEWTRWNNVMRDQLVKTQHPLKDGHLAGSWDVADPHGGAAGRLYMTCLCVMTLEVYYRHLPMYSREKIKVEF